MKKERTAGLILKSKTDKITMKQIRRIPEDFKGDIIANDDIYCSNQDVIIPGNLWLNGDLEVQYLKVKGDLFIKKGKLISAQRGIDVCGDLVQEHCNIGTKTINVGGDLEATGTITSTDINVCGKFKFSGLIDNKGYKIHAGEIDFDKVSLISSYLTIKTGR